MVACRAKQPGGGGGVALWEVISCFEWITNTRGGDKIWVNEPFKGHTTLPVTHFKVCIPQTMCGMQHPVAVQASHDAHHATPQWSGQRLITIDHKLSSQRFINTNIWMSSFWDRPALHTSLRLGTEDIVMWGLSGGSLLPGWRIFLKISGTKRVAGYHRKESPYTMSHIIKFIELPLQLIQKITA